MHRLRIEQMLPRASRPRFLVAGWLAPAKPVAIMEFWMRIEPGVPSKAKLLVNNAVVCCTTKVSSLLVSLIERSYVSKSLMKSTPMLRLLI